MTSDLSEAAARVGDAIQRHLAAVLDSSSDRPDAGRELAAAVEAYAIAVFNVGGASPQDLEDLTVRPWLGEEDGLEEEPYEPDPVEGEVVTLFLRIDLVVSDPEKLLHAGRDLVNACCDHGGETPSANDLVFHTVAQTLTPLDPVWLEGMGLREESSASMTLSDVERDPVKVWSPLSDTIAEEQSFGDD